MLVPPAVSAPRSPVLQVSHFQYLPDLHTIDNAHVGALISGSGTPHRASAMIAIEELPRYAAEFGRPQRSGCAVRTRSLVNADHDT